MSIVTFYRNDPCAPKTTMPTRLGANAIILWDGKLLLEKRSDCDDCWGLPGGGVKSYETGRDAIAREIYEELGLRIPKQHFEKLAVYGEPGRIAAYRDGSIWQMVIVVYGLNLTDAPILRISSESKELRFFTKEELSSVHIPVTHSDIVQDWFLNR